MTQHIKNLILDMDGVLWRGDTPMPDLVDFITTIQQLGLGIALATNNAAKTPTQYIAKLAGFGIHTIPEEQILTSAEATASYLSRELEEGASVYIIGGDGIHHAFRRRGYRILTTEQAYHGASAAVVVVGFYRHITYDDLAMGCHLILNGAKFVGTNPDVTFPHELGLLPGAGATLAFLQAATGIEPMVIGKPGPIMFEEALQRLGGSTADTVMIGDRLNTDIAGGKGAGLTTFMVLTGISQTADLPHSPIQPDHNFENLSAIAQALQNGRLPHNP